MLDILINNWLFKRYFDNEEKKCKEFSYGGCGGNENNFNSVEECETSCGEE